MTRLRPLLSRLTAPEADEPSPARRSRRDWTVDSALFLLAAVFGATTGLTSARHGLHGPLLVVDAIGGAGLCLTLWWRRRWPLSLGLVSLPVLAVSSSAGPAGVIILYTVAAYRRWQLAALVAAGQVALLPAGRVLHSQGNSLAAYYLAGTLGTAVIVAWGMFRQGRRQSRWERARHSEAEQQLRVEQIRYAERTRIAREMHDVLAHRISLLSLHAGALEFRPDAAPEEIARAAAVIRASAHQALEDLRAIIGVLRDGADGETPQPPQPTLAALPGLLDESRAAGMGLRADLRVADLASVPDPIGRHALRIVQEALTNARKHAASAPVDLRIEGAPGNGLTIEVRNPAPVLAAGGPKIPGSGAGLVGLAERATLSGGHLEHGLDENGEFRLLAWLPWPR
ncbi:MAG TPA: histidine kinase [Streptosporangiaceae bacterium]|nr:histidine kinase [Streptosporangiaceae bacterium]